MKKRKTEVDILLEEMGIIEASSMNSVIYNLKKRCGEELAKAIEACVYQRGEDDDEPNDDKIYYLMNSSVDAAITFVGGFDGGYFKSALEEIMSCSDHMGKSVIDIGCNNGLFTCSLAKLFPESHFLGVDINEQSINTAKEMAKHYGISNVNFDVCSFFDISNKYDTIIMSKVVHEMVNTLDIDWSRSRANVVKNFMNLFDPVAEKIRACIYDDGTIISIERFPELVETYGYVKALCNHNINVEIENYKRIRFRAIGERESMPFIIGSVGNSNIERIEEQFDEELDRVERDYYRNL